MRRATAKTPRSTAVAPSCSCCSSSASLPSGTSSTSRASRSYGACARRTARSWSGAAVTHRELERSAVVHERLPALAKMERSVANLRVREVGTLGGNLCFSDPHSDPATFLLAVDAEVECRRGEGAARRLPIGDFVVGPYQTSLEHGELLTAVRIPSLTRWRLGRAREVLLPRAADRHRRLPGARRRRRPGRGSRSRRVGGRTAHSVAGGGGGIDRSACRRTRRRAVDSR